MLSQEIVTQTSGVSDISPTMTLVPWEGSSAMLDWISLRSLSPSQTKLDDLRLGC